MDRSLVFFCLPNNLKQCQRGTIDQDNSKRNNNYISMQNLHHVFSIKSISKTFLMKIWSIVTVLESFMLTSNKLSLLSGPELSLLSLGLALNVEENWFVRIIYFVERVVWANWVIFNLSIPVFLIPVLVSFTTRILFKLKFNFYSSNQIKLQIKYSTVI